MNVQKILAWLASNVFLLLLMFGGGFVLGYFGHDQRSSTTGPEYSYQISRVLELERSANSRERTRLVSEGDRLRAENGRISRERDRLKREREAINSDRADLKRLNEIFDEIRKLSEVH